MSTPCWPSNTSTDSCTWLFNMRMDTNRIYNVTFKWPGLRQMNGQCGQLNFSPVCFLRCTFKLASKLAEKKNVVYFKSRNSNGLLMGNVSMIFHLCLLILLEVMFWYVIAHLLLILYRTDAIIYRSLRVKAGRCYL